MTEKQGRQLLILAARADYLAKLRQSKHLSENDYIARLNDLRRQIGLDPLETESSSKVAFIRPASCAI